MRTSAQLIAAAKAAAAAKDGVRRPVRFPSAMIARARLCATDVDEQIGDWINKACRQWQAGKLSDVATDENHELATRELSEVITVRAPADMPAEDIKKAVRACCSYCEARRIVFNPDPAPALYFLEASE